MRQDLRNILYAIVHVERDYDETETERCHVKADPVSAVGKPHCDAVARIQAFARKRLLETSGARFDACPRIVNPTVGLAVILPVGSSKRSALGTLVKKPRQGSSAFCTN
jgi:hypothetical protein